MKSNLLQRTIKYIRPGKKKAVEDLEIKQKLAAKERVNKQIDSKVDETTSSSISQFTRASTTFLENGQKRNEGLLRETLKPGLLVAGDQFQTSTRRRRRKRRKQYGGKQSRSLSSSEHWRFQRAKTSRNHSSGQDYNAPKSKRKRKMGKCSMKKLTEEMATSLTI